MKKDEVALEIHDGNEALRHSGKKHTLSYLDYITLLLVTWYVIIIYFFLGGGGGSLISTVCACANF